ncbi:MAG: hypothetical protein KGS10_05525 [Chloroflexi bacterium]|nr:hypothetical protein [Chloroflexota bacterium]
MARIGILADLDDVDAHKLRRCEVLITDQPTPYSRWHGSPVMCLTNAPSVAFRRDGAAVIIGRDGAAVAKRARFDTAPALAVVPSGQVAAARQWLAKCRPPCASVAVLGVGPSTCLEIDLTPSGLAGLSSLGDRAFLVVPPPEAPYVMPDTPPPVVVAPEPEPVPEPAVVAPPMAAPSVVTPAAEPVMVTDPVPPAPADPVAI